MQENEKQKDEKEKEGIDEKFRFDRPKSSAIESQPPDEVVE